MDLTKAAHGLNDEKRTCRAVIETPKGKRSKYDYDPQLRAFALKSLLPEGMSFPLDFGFIPSTRAEDGDPLDVLVLTAEPSEVGAVIEVRLMGVIEANQTEDGKTLRNDRVLAVACVSRLYADIHEPSDLGDEYVRHLGEFWTQYNALKNKRFEILQVAGPDAAAEAVRRTQLG